MSVGASVIRSVVDDGWMTSAADTYVAGTRMTTSRPPASVAHADATAFGSIRRRRRRRRRRRPDDAHEASDGRRDRKTLNATSLNAIRFGSIGAGVGFFGWSNDDVGDAKRNGERNDERTRSDGGGDATRGWSVVVVVGVGRGEEEDGKKNEKSLERGASSGGSGWAPGRGRGRDVVR